MKTQYDHQTKMLTVFLDGEIDHHSALDMRMEIDRLIKDKQPKKLMLDYGEVTFMDSSGIGLIMGRHKLMKSISGSVEVSNVPNGLYKMIKLSGIEKLGKVSSKNGGQK